LHAGHVGDGECERPRGGRLTEETSFLLDWDVGGNSWNTIELQDYTYTHFFAVMAEGANWGVLDRGPQLRLGLSHLDFRQLALTYLRHSVPPALRTLFLNLGARDVILRHLLSWHRGCWRPFLGVLRLLRRN